MAKLTVEELEQRHRAATERIEALELGGGVSDHGNSAHTPDFAEDGHTHATIGDADADTTFETERVGDDDVARVKAEALDVMEWTKHAGTGQADAKVLAFFSFPNSTEKTLTAAGVLEADQSIHTIAAFSGSADDCEGLSSAPASTWLRVANKIGDTITLKHQGTGTLKFYMPTGNDIVLSAIGDNALFIIIGSTIALVSHETADDGISKIFQFPAHDEDLAVGVMGARPGTNTGEAGEHGDYTLLRATAIAGTVGSGAGATTILIEVDDNPAFSSATTLFTITLTATTEAVDTTAAAWTATDIFMRARCTAIEAVAPKDVNVMVMAKERLFNG